MNPDDLIQWREAHGLSQTELAALLGVTRGCISRWESEGAIGRHIPAFLPLALKCLKVKKGGEKKSSKGTTKMEKERKVKK